MSLRTQGQQKRSITPWLVAGLGIVMLCNAALVAWIWTSDDEVESASEPTRPAVRRPVLPAPAPALAQQQAPAQNQATKGNQERKPQPKSVPEEITPPPMELVQLAELPAAEQTLYNGFNYSSHIYTDEPNLCVIVVDGQRLKAGDSFKGLAVIAITESGVIFEENRRGQRRRIEVSVLEQWDR